MVGLNFSSFLMYGFLDQKRLPLMFSVFQSIAYSGKKNHDLCVLSCHWFGGWIWFDIRINCVLVNLITPAIVFMVIYVGFLNSLGADFTIRYIPELGKVV